MPIEEKIIALGVDRTGCQMVDHMLDRKIEGVAFADMRFQAKPGVLSQFTAPLKFNVQSEDECKKIIDENFRHADIIFVIGDSPLAPCAAKAAKDLGILTIGICLSNNEELKVMLKEASDAFIQLGELIGYVQNVVEGISSLVTKSGFVNIDVDDVKNILRDVGTAYIGVGHDAGEYRAKCAALQATGMFRVKNAKRVLLNITTGNDVSLGEMSEAAGLIEEIAAPDAQVIWGHVIDENMSDDFKVTFVAGLDDKRSAHHNTSVERSVFMPFSNEESLLREVSEKVSKFYASTQHVREDFNVFEILGVETRETRICRFLCELLSPSGSHHQGIFFLKSFVKNVLGLNIPDEELENADVSREYTISNGRRIDILIRTERHFIPIEVKIYAWDLENQCRDYYDEAARHCEDASVFYLTPNGREPSPASSCGVPVNCISFGKIHEWISDCIGQPEIAEVAPVREVLLQFAATIKKITGRMEEKLKMEIIELLTSSPENMKTAARIIPVLEKALETALQTKLFETVERMLEEKNIRPVKDKGLHYTHQSFVLFYHNAEGDDAKLGVRFDVEEYHGGPWVYVGEFTLQGKKWGNFEKVRFNDDDVEVNFGKPEHVSRLCDEEEMNQFAGYCAERIRTYLDNVNSSQNA